MSENDTEQPSIQQNWHEADTATTSVVTAIAALTGLPPTGMDPLYESVDPDALERVLESGSDGSCRSSALSVSFSHEGCRVKIRADGQLTVRLQRAEQ
jgi:hypothetical protein